MWCEVHDDKVFAGALCRAKVHGVNKVSIVLLWEKNWSRGLAAGQVCRRKLGVVHTVSKLDGHYWGCAVPTGVFVSRLEDREGKWHLPAAFFLDKFPNDPCPSSTDSEISK